MGLRPHHVRLDGAGGPPEDGEVTIADQVSIGLLGRSLNAAGFDCNDTRQPLAAWATLVGMASGTGRRSSCCSPTPALAAIPEAYCQLRLPAGVGL